MHHQRHDRRRGPVRGLSVIAALAVGLTAWGWPAGPSSAAAPESAAQPILERRAPGQDAAAVADGGNSSVAPDSTGASFRSAVFAGTGLMRVTVRLTRDGVPVVHRDEALDRTSNGGGTVAGTTSAQLASLDAGSWFSKDYAQQRVLTLTDYARTYPADVDGTVLNLPAQTWNRPAALRRLPVVLNSVNLDSTLVESDSPQVLRAVRGHSRSAQLVLQTGRAAGRSADNALAGTARQLGLTAVDLDAKALARTGSLVARLERAGVFTIAGDADDPSAWTIATRLGVEAIVTTRPDRLAGWQQGRHQTPLSGKAPMIAGHRGDSSVLPENSLASHEGGWRDGVDYAEDDINLSADGRYVVMHDRTVDRTTQGSGDIWTLGWPYINSLEVGSWKASEFDGLFVPQLSEVLTAMKRSDLRATGSHETRPRKLLLEFKDDWTQQQAAGVIRQIRAAGLTHRVFLQGFSMTTMKNLAVVAPKMERGYLINTVSADDDPVALAREARVQWLNPGSGALTAHPGFATELHKAGFKTAVWTLDKPEQWNAAMSEGADMVITNRSDYLAGWLAGRS